MMNELEYQDVVFKELEKLGANKLYVQFVESFVALTPLPRIESIAVIEKSIAGFFTDAIRVAFALGVKPDEAAETITETFKVESEKFIGSIIPEQKVTH